VFGAALGEQNHTLSAAELPPHSHSGTTGGADRSLDHTHNVPVQAGTFVANLTGGGAFGFNVGASTVTSGGVNGSIDHLHSFTPNAGNGLAGAAHNVTQPTIVCNYIIRVL